LSDVRPLAHPARRANARPREYPPKRVPLSASTGAGLRRPSFGFSFLESQAKRTRVVYATGSGTNDSAKASSSVEWQSGVLRATQNRPGLHEGGPQSGKTPLRRAVCTLAWVSGKAMPVRGPWTIHRAHARERLT